MLSTMRKNAKNWFIKVLLFMIIIVFIAYFGTTKGREMSEPIATLDGKAITYGDYYKEYQNLMEIFRSQLGDKLTDEMLKKLDLKQQAYDSVINSAIVQTKAAELNITVTDDEVKQVILAYPAFHVNGAFDERTYQMALRSMKLTPEEFETMQKRGLMTLKVESLIQGGIKISEKEVFDLYSLQNEKINISFVRIAPRDVSGRVTPSQGELEAYLKEHGDEFRVQDRVQLKYLVFRGDAYQDSAKITEADIADYYARNKEKFSRKTKDGKTTVLPLAEVRDRVVAEVRKINGMYAAADHAKKAHDTIYQDEKLDAYAAQNKLTVHTTGYFSAAGIPDEFKEIRDFGKSVFGLQKDEISRVVSDEKAYYLFKLADKKPSYIPVLKDVRADVEKRYVTAEAQKLSRKEAEAIIERTKKGEKLASIAQQKGLKVDETGLFSPGEKIPKIGTSKELGEALYQLSEKSPNASSPYYIDGGVIVVQFKERGALDNKDYAAKKSPLMGMLLRMKMKETVSSWLEGNRAAMIKDGRLKIKKEVKAL